MTINLAQLARHEIPNLDSLNAAPKNYLTGLAFLVGDEGIKSRFISRLKGAHVAMTAGQEHSITVENGIIKSPMIPMFKEWLGLRDTSAVMTPQFEKALCDPEIAAGIAAKWQEHINPAKSEMAKAAAKPLVAPVVQPEEPEEKPSKPAVVKPVVAKKPMVSNPVARTKPVSEDAPPEVEKPKVLETPLAKAEKPTLPEPVPQHVLYRIETSAHDRNSVQNEMLAKAHQLSKADPLLKRMDIISALANPEQKNGAFVITGSDRMQAVLAKLSPQAQQELGLVRVTTVEAGVKPSTGAAPSPPPKGNEAGQPHPHAKTPEQRPR